MAGSETRFGTGVDNSAVQRAEISGHFLGTGRSYYPLVLVGNLRHRRGRPGLGKFPSGPVLWAFTQSIRIDLVAKRLGFFLWLIVCIWMAALAEFHTSLGLGRVVRGTGSAPLHGLRNRGA